MLLGMVILSQIEIKPRRRLVEIPIAGIGRALIKLHFLAVFLQSGVSPHVYAFFLSGMDFTPAVETAATGSVALALRTL